MASSDPVDPSTPMEVFEAIRTNAVDMLKLAMMESGKGTPTPEHMEALFLPVLGIGIAAASEYYARNPEHLALAGAPICTVCREPVQSLQVGIDPARDEGDVGPVKIAWPCGHLQ